MEGVYHVHVIEVGSCSLISDVDRMFQWQIPYWESLKLGITGTHATLVLIIQLAEADCHLATARTWSSHNNQWSLCLHIVVLTESLVRGYQLHIMWITFYQVMTISLDALTL